MMYYVLFFFKQKTAYEMRISDWSSDVCSSDLTLFDAVSDGAVLFDGIDMPSLAAAGDLMQARGTRFAVGSSGVTRALVMAWQASGVIAPPAAPERAAEVGRMLVVSGTCSPVTAAPIAGGPIGPQGCRRGMGKAVWLRVVRG